MSIDGKNAAQDAFILGDALARQGDLLSARGALQTAISLNDPEWSPRAACVLGDLLWTQGDPAGAEPFLAVARDSGHPDWAPAAEVVQGVICASRRDVSGAMRAYGAAIASEHPKHAANAWFNLGTLHQQRGEWTLAVIAFRRAIDFRHPEFSPKAAVNLGYVLFNHLGQVEEAEQAFAVAVNSGNQEQAELAKMNLATMRHLAAANRRGDRHAVVDDSVDVSTGRGKGGLKWRQWIRRDRS
jgi:tetratricopeptide (TPR) repeat protein